MSNARLNGVDLSGARSRDLDLNGADLSGANLRDANLSGTDLRETDIWEADLRGACGDAKTLPPEGFPDLPFC